MPMKAKWPGIDLPPDSICQLLEEEIMKAEDYEWIGELARGAPVHLHRLLHADDLPGLGRYRRGWKGYTVDASRLLWNFANWRYDFEQMKKRGTTVLYGFLPEAAFDTFSLARGLPEFSRDLKKRPEEIATPADDLTEGYLFVVPAGVRG